MPAVMLRTLFRAFLCLAAASTSLPLSAQSVWRARLSGDQVIPPRQGNELAFADLFLDPGSGALLARVDAPAGTAAGAFARVRRGAPGALPAESLFVLSAVDPYRFSGALPSPTPAQLAELARGEWHMELLPPPSLGSTPLLRGALHVGQDAFHFSGDGAQALPPTASSGRFAGNFGFAPDGRATYTIFANAGSPVLHATLRFGDATRESNEPLFTMLPTIGGSGALFLGSTPALSEAQRARLQEGQVWLTIATQAHPDTVAQPGGELRGTLRATAVEYGSGQGANGFAPRLLNLFPWSPGSLLLLGVQHDPSGGTFAAGFVCASLAPLFLPLPSLGDLWIDPTQALVLPLPSSGLLQGSVPVGVQRGLWIYLQFLGLGPQAEPYVSPGLAVQTVW
ncbi:MAG: hypothetical protein IPN34_27380 [Planctomycetes bacterium]|nr:hypothetical protein [Planctomycetota bacterium]